MPGGLPTFFGGQISLFSRFANNPPITSLSGERLCCAVCVCVCVCVCLLFFNLSRWHIFAGERFHSTSNVSITSQHRDHLLASPSRDILYLWQLCCLQASSRINSSCWSSSFSLVGQGNTRRKAKKKKIKAMSERRPSGFVERISSPQLELLSGQRPQKSALSFAV